MPEIPAYILYLLAMLVSAAISVYAVRKIIFITRTRKIYDVPDNIRKIHGAQIPSLGGIGIFTGYVITAMFFITDPKWYYIIAASVILFFTGIYDDIMNMRPSKKLVAQVVASAIAVLLADVRIKSLYGIAGIYELPYTVSVGLTIFCCTFFINVFNFMDGIDGLACTLAIFYILLLGLSISGADYRYEYLAGISFCLAGATLGLALFNRPPAKIYMGDTGSMFLGFTIFVLAVMLLNATEYEPYNSDEDPNIRYFDCIMFLLSMLFLPIYDALRVFALRVWRGVSPFHADRLHLHYYLLDAGLSHGAAVGIILATTIVTMVMSLLLYLHPLIQLLSMIYITSIPVFWAANRRKKRSGPQQPAS